MERRCSTYYPCPFVQDPSHSHRYVCLKCNYKRTVGTSQELGFGNFVAIAIAAMFLALIFA